MSFCVARGPHDKPKNRGKVVDNLWADRGTPAALQRFMRHPFFLLLLSITISLLGCGGDDDVTPPPDEPDPAL